MTHPPGPVDGSGRFATPDVLRDVVERLAPIPRLPTSAGEHEAAGIIRDLLSARGCTAVVEQVEAHHSYAWPIGLMSGLAAVSALAAGRGHRLLGTLGGAVAALGIADDITGTAMLCRRAALRPRLASNVVASTGDRTADRTLVVLAHHDAAPSGAVFDQRLSRWVADRHPGLIAAMSSNPPLWWPVVAAPALVSVGSLVRRPALRRAGLAAALLTLAAMLDIGRRPAVPGANDNLTGVAVLVALAEALQTRPLPGLRVLLVSAGAEEALQEGIRGFARGHFPELPADRTWFLTVDTVGSGRLVLLEGEGPLRVHDYDAGLKDLTATCARREQIPLTRGLRSHNSTDAAVPRRHGYPVATLVSLDEQKLIPHYHLDTDTPDHVDYACVARAARLVEAVARALAPDPALRGRR